MRYTLSIKLLHLVSNNCNDICRLCSACSSAENSLIWIKWASNIYGETAKFLKQWHNFFNSDAVDIGWQARQRRMSKICPSCISVQGKAGSNMSNDAKHCSYWFAIDTSYKLWSYTFCEIVALKLFVFDGPWSTTIEKTSRLWSVVMTFSERHSTRDGSFFTPPATAQRSVAAASVYGLPRVGFFIFVYFFLRDFVRMFATDRSEIWPQCVDWARMR